MNIQNNIFYNKPSFQANPDSPLLKFANKDFFVNIKGYGKSNEWAEMAIKSTDLGASLIRRGTSGENVLKIITSGIKKANDIGTAEKCAKTVLSIPMYVGMTEEEQTRVIEAINAFV